MLNVILDPNLLNLIESFAWNAGTYILGIGVCRRRRLVGRIKGLFLQHLSKFELASPLEISGLLSLVVHLSASKTLI